MRCLGIGFCKLRNFCCLFFLPEKLIIFEYLSRWLLFIILVNYKILNQGFFLTKFTKHDMLNSEPLSICFKCGQNQDRRNIGRNEHLLSIYSAPGIEQRDSLSLFQFSFWTILWGIWYYFHFTGEYTEIQTLDSSNSKVQALFTSRNGWSWWIFSYTSLNQELFSYKRRVVQVGQCFCSWL